MNSIAIPMVCHVLQGFLLKSLDPHYPLSKSKVTQLLHILMTFTCKDKPMTNVSEMLQTPLYCLTNQDWLYIRRSPFSYPPKSSRFWGLELNSVKMTLQLAREKATGLQRVCKELLTCPSLSIREVAKVIGKIVPGFSGVMHGALYYRHLEKDKPQALQRTKGNFDASMSLLSPAKSELQFWIKNVVPALPM